MQLFSLKSTLVRIKITFKTFFSYFSVLHLTYRNCQPSWKPGVAPSYQMSYLYMFIPWVSFSVDALSKQKKRWYCAILTSLAVLWCGLLLAAHQVLVLNGPVLTMIAKSQPTKHLCWWNSWYLDVRYSTKVWKWKGTLHLSSKGSFDWKRCPFICVHWPWRWGSPSFLFSR